TRVAHHASANRPDRVRTLVPCARESSGATVFHRREMRTMRARDIMSSPVYTVRPVDTVEQAAELLSSRNITAAPVVDEAGCLIGMVSEGDLLWHRVDSDPTAHLRPEPATLAAVHPKIVSDVM